MIAAAAACVAAGHRSSTNYWPSGWSNISSNWNGLCSYTGNSNNNALCNVPINTHSWQASSKGLGFICGVRKVITPGAVPSPAARRPPSHSRAVRPASSSRCTR